MKTTSTRSQQGFTLVELMIALAIGLFLVAGLLTLVQAMKRSNTNQSGLSQLQESQRMAMTLVTDVVQSTGYFYNPLINTAASSFPVTGAFTFAGQALVGAGVGTSTVALNNTLTVRYLTNGTDNVINCTGNISGVPATFVNQFSVDVNGNLQCILTVNGVVKPAVPLISGIKSMQIYYGVQTNNTVTTNSVDTYMDGNSVTAGGYWNAVKSVKITLNFINPLVSPTGALQAGQTSLTIPFTRVIAVMNKTGVTT
jgi:type IV pilus assembly protein PilW